MYKFKRTIPLLIIFSLLLISCFGDSPEATVEKMKEAACNADVEGFSSYIDKDDYEKIYRQNEYDNYIESLKDKPGPLIIYLDRLFYINSNYFGYDPDAYFLQRDWEDTRDDIEKGTAGKICQLEIIGPGEEKNSVIVETPFQGKLIWIFKHSWGQYKLIDFDSLDDEEQTAGAVKHMEQLRQAACEGDVKEFFSHIDKEAIARNFKKDLVNKLKTKYGEKYSGWDQLVYYYNFNTYIGNMDDSDIETPFSHEYIMDLYQRTLWDLFEQQVEMGKEGGVCTMEMEIPEEESDEFSVDDKSIRGAWSISTGLSDWHVVKVNLDSYIANRIGEELYKEE